MLRSLPVASFQPKTIQFRNLTRAVSEQRSDVLTESARNWS